MLGTQIEANKSFQVISNVELVEMIEIER